MRFIENFNIYRTASRHETDLFTKRDLRLLLIPLIIEQMLNSLMGMMDTMMVSRAGSSAISAVSLVDSINNLVIQLFMALAAGGTIICSQYLGRNDLKNGNRAARQVTLAAVFIAAVMMIVCLIFRVPLLHLIFGSVSDAVMTNSRIYFFITVLSYPFLAMYCTGSSIYRAQGNSRFPMTVSMISNVINVAGNAILIFGFQMGVAGAAIATLISRIFYAVTIMYFLGRPNQAIVINSYRSVRPDFPMIYRILALGVPAGIEQGMFQFGKLAIQSTVSTLGTEAIAAQAMTNILEMVNGIAAMGIGIGLMTVVGQCMGAGKQNLAGKYILQLTAYSEIVVIIMCLLTLLLTRPITLLAGMSSESASLCFHMMVFITITKPIVWTLSFIPAYGMRAAGDVKFSMVVSMCSMWIFRVSLCIFLCRFMGMGPIAVWIAMVTDWTIRGILFTIRFLSGRWYHKVI